jgi:hypothetical protein
LQDLATLPAPDTSGVAVENARIRIDCTHQRTPKTYECPWRQVTHLESREERGEKPSRRIWQKRQLFFR